MTGLPGRTHITARALDRLAAGLARDAADVSLRHVKTNLADSSGELAVSVAVPIALGGGSGGTVTERGEKVREGVRRGMRELAGRTVNEVEVTFTGVLRTQERRVQ